jgi:hypothetical protein
VPIRQVMIVSLSSNPVPCAERVYAAAPEMKNHLSMLGSMGAGTRFSFCGI